MAHRTVRLNEEDERHIAIVQEHFRRGPIPIEIHWNEVIRTGLRHLAERVAEDQPEPPTDHEHARANGSTESRTD